MQTHQTNRSMKLRDKIENYIPPANLYTSCATDITRKTKNYVPPRDNDIQIASERALREFDPPFLKGNDLRRTYVYLLTSPSRVAVRFLSYIHHEREIIFHPRSNR